MTGKPPTLFKLSHESAIDRGAKLAAKHERQREQEALVAEELRRARQALIAAVEMLAPSDLEH